MDDKGRVAIPSRCRSYATVIDEREVWYITRGFEKCLMLFTAEAWGTMMEENLSGLSMGKKDHRIFIRSFVSPAVEVQADKQGRILLPPHLREYAEIARDVVILGAGKYLEIWDQAAYRAEQEQYGNLDRIGEQLSEFGL